MPQAVVYDLADNAQVDIRQISLDRIHIATEVLGAVINDMGDHLLFILFISIDPDLIIFGMENKIIRDQVLFKFCNFII